MKELAKSYSKLRQYDVEYLSYLIIDKIVDHLSTVINLIWNHFSKLRKLSRSIGILDPNYVHNIKTATMSIRRKVKPFRKVLLHIIADNGIAQGVSVYYRDVLDNLELIDDSLNALISGCDELKEEYTKMQSALRDRTVYTLTVVATIFLPAQFLTGVYGMNFDNMPELHYYYSYYLFWVFIIFFFMISLIYSRCGSARVVEHKHLVLPR
mmetsp:Transcript_15507/g.19902  ORF Transcript_15507/g.19902 Transcript_15507/m.19902 type:complete len:210 (-) Transcript_15507:1493-2122(-)